MIVNTTNAVHTLLTDLLTAQSYVLHIQKQSEVQLFDRASFAGVTLLLKFLAVAQCFLLHPVSFPQAL